MSAITLACLGVQLVCVFVLVGCSLSGVRVWELCALVKAGARRKACQCRRHQGQDGRVSGYLSNEKIKKKRC
jgi:hypothetical protein